MTWVCLLLNFINPLHFYEGWNLFPSSLPLFSRGHGYGTGCTMDFAWSSYLRIWHTPSSNRLQTLPGGDRLKSSSLLDRDATRRSRLNAGDRMASPVARSAALLQTHGHLICSRAGICEARRGCEGMRSFPSAHRNPCVLPLA